MMYRRQKNVSPLQETELWKTFILILLRELDVSHSYDPNGRVGHAMKVASNAFCAWSK